MVSNRKVRDIQARDRSIGFLIFGFLLACYLFTYTGVIQSSDGLAMFATTESLARRGEANTNQILWMGLQQGDFGPDGNLYSRKGLGMPLLALPLVWLARAWNAIGLVQAALLLNPILTAWTGALLYRTGRRLAWSRSTSVIGALIFGMATLAWPYTQTFFSDPVCGWGLFAASYGLLAYAQTGRKRYLVMAGMAWGIAYLARVINLVTLPIYLIGLYLVLESQVKRQVDDHPGWRAILRYNWRPIISFLLPVIAVGLISLWWNWARFGHIFETGYAETERFDALWWFGIAGMLVSPGRGLIWYSPILLLVIPGAVWFWRNERRIFWLISSVVVTYVLFYGKWYMWHGGHSWGPRFLVPMMPFLSLMAGAGWAEMVRLWGVWGRALAWALFAISVAVQWLGMLVPFGLVQEWLAATFEPLYAPETFISFRTSPLLLQWQFLAPENIHLAWWRTSQVAGSFSWFTFLAPVVGIIIGVFLISRMLRRSDVTDDTAPVDSSQNWLYGVSLLLIILLVLAYYKPYLSDDDNRAIAGRIHAQEQSGDAILHLIPEETQQFANAYHGRLHGYGLFARETLEPTDADLLSRLRTSNRRLWVVPDSTSPELSGWESVLRSNEFLLIDSRPTGEGGDRMALYALSDGYSLAQVGLGTIFGDPNGPGPITADSGWIRLEGYALTEQATPGGEVLVLLAWRSMQAVDYDYHVFVHLLNSDGDKVAQRDGQPVQWTRPTSTWTPETEIIDRYGMLLPVDLPVGDYTIAVGLYDPVNGQRLPISAGPGDYAVELGPVQVVPSR